MVSFGILSTVLKRSEVAAKIELLTRKPRLLIGPAGVGKTHLAFTLGELLWLPVYKFACTEMSTAADLIGGNQADPYGRQPLWWVPGPALTAMGYGLENPNWRPPTKEEQEAADKAGIELPGPRPKPGILLVDDMHLAVNSDAMGALMQVLDCGPGGNIMLPTGQTVHAPGPDKFRVICTANGEIDSFPEAIRSRLGGSILVNEPSKEQLALLQPRLLARCCMADYKCSTGPLLSYRHWLTLSELWGLIDLATAVMVATDSNQQLAASLVEILAAEGCQEAGALLTEMASVAPSGAPGGL